MDEFSLFPQQASTVATKVDMLFYVLTGLSLFFALLIAGLVVYFGIKYRRGAGVDRSGPVHTSLRLEVSWIASLTVLSMIMFGWGARVYVEMYQMPRDGMNIYVMGQQWMWQVQYPTGQREINTLHVPVHQVVRLTMVSEDVIHSFYVPAFRIKRDVLPGRYTTLWFEATQTGEYHLFCAEYCGTQHSGMVGKVVVMEPSQYQAWLQATRPAGQSEVIPQHQGAGGEQQPQTMAQAGAQFFQNFGCSSCHVMQGQGTGPSLVGLFGKQVQLENGDVVVADEQYIRRSILDPQAQIVKGYPPIMPTFAGQINEDELMRLVEYIRNLHTAEAGDNTRANNAANQTP